MKIYKISLIALLALLFISCEKDTADLSVSTYYVAFHIEGDNPMIVQVGDEFVDPGCIATLQGVDVTTGMTVESNVDADVMGLYRVEYSGVNADGLTSRAIREVIVCNPNVTTDISGDYYAVDGTHRITDGVQHDYSGSNMKTKITRLAPGFFSVTDFFAGYYTEYRGYGGGALYAMNGYIALNEDNTIDLISSSITAWGDELDALNNALYNPETGNIYWEADYAQSMTFYVTLTK